MNIFEKNLERLVRYTKINTRSEAKSNTIPSTEKQLELLNLLVEELTNIGMEDVNFNPKNAFVTATLPSNTSDDVPSIGFIAHVDTADFNSENVNPQIIENYQGEKIILNQEKDIVMDPEDFPNLLNYMGETLVTTDGTTLLGADDKAGIAEIMTAMEYLINNPQIPHGQVKVAFGPDEEIGRGADHFDAETFATDFAYTVDGGPAGELEYESFNAAQAEISVTGLNIHPGTAKDKMINSITILNQFINLLPPQEVPELTEGRQGFYHIISSEASVDQGYLELIIRDHDREKFEERKQVVANAVKTINNQYPYEVMNLNLYDQYYNMGEIIEKDMTSVELAIEAMKAQDISPIIKPIRGGTDGSKISFMGIPTPNIFAGGENMHGRYEYVSVETMVKATNVIIDIIKFNVD